MDHGPLFSWPQGGSLARLAPGAHRPVTAANQFIICFHASRGCQVDAQHALLRHSLTLCVLGMHLTAASNRSFPFRNIGAPRSPHLTWPCLPRSAPRRARRLTLHRTSYASDCATGRGGARGAGRGAAWCETFSYDRLDLNIKCV